jgi:hypothetical protein
MGMSNVCEHGQLRRQCPHCENIESDKRIAELETENQRYREALEAVIKKDQRCMYERCPDCFTDSCTVEKKCREVPLSLIGKTAVKALGGRGGD